MTNLSCEVIQDLLPLYIDEACSEQSKELIINHLTICENCKTQFEAMNSEMSLAMQADQTEEQRQEMQAMQTLAKAWRKTKLLSWIKGIAVATCTCGLLIAVYLLLTEWKIVPVSAEHFEVNHVYRLSDGSITYWLRATDGYELHMLKTHYDKQGNAYIQGYRPIIKKKAELMYGLHNYLHRIELKTVQQIDVSQLDLNNHDAGEGMTFNITNKDTINDFGTEITGVYYGNKENSLLIWKEGMELPKASEELEKYWFELEDFKEFPAELMN